MVLLLFTAASPALADAKKRSHLLVALGSNGYTIISQSNTGIEAPVGSLLKPFAAWYLLEKGQKPDSSVFCPPERKRHEGLRCWTPQGHGRVDLAAALVQSCNYYFLSLFSGRDLADYQAWLTSHFDWPANLPIRRPVNVYGFDLDSGIEAERLVKMYQALLQAADSGSSHAVAVRDALAGICRGTLSDFCRKMQEQPDFRLLIGKTGTVQSGKKPYGIALLVLEHLSSKEKILLICYEREKTGSVVAMAAPAILSRYADKIRKSKNLRR
ncbi:MAG TPA: penicillin-binding transpeptidase domain-containing protein [Turneriella sp.]|nr:penicillin-binding transpeptidase domain-containing protein [Turneriella sp.]